MSQKPTLSIEAFELLGLKPKDFSIYVTLLGLGSAPLRRIAEKAKLNRGTTYDALKRLIDIGLVSFVDAKSHRYFTSEDPKKLKSLAMRREFILQEAREKIEKKIPELAALVGKSEHRPAVRYYEGNKGVRDILEDVLEVTARTENKTFRVYSSSEIRDLIASAWPSFKTTRVKKKIAVHAISIGEGGTTVGLDARRWLTTEKSSPTYIFIYGDRTAYVAVDENNNLFGVIIEDGAVAQTQRMIFDKLWETLPV